MTRPIRIGAGMLLVALLLMATATHAQMFMLKGTVIRASDNMPLRDCQVIVDRFQQTTTNSEGQFQLGLDHVPTQVVTHCKGYQSDTIHHLEQQWPGGRAAFEIKIVLPVLPVSGNAGIVTMQRVSTMQSVEIFDYVHVMDKLSVGQYLRGDGSSVEMAMNLVPGVRYESRGPGGSRRLAIRGSYLRSPFGVRDVKVYMGSLPLTSPDGSTALELIDAVSVGRASIHKGPCASQYGPVSNGVISFLQPEATAIGRSGGALDQTIGSYGYARTAAQCTWRPKDEYRQRKLVLGYVHQQYSGYREQEANQKDMLSLSGNFRIQRISLSGAVLLYDGTWGLPGALDSAQVAANPRQALAISKALDAHVERRHLRAQMTGVIPLRDRLSMVQAAYLHFADKVNPYGTSAFNQGYKLENSQGFGGNTDVLRTIAHGYIRVGAEYQREWLQYHQFDNHQGQPGPLNTRSITASSQAHAFAIASIGDADDLLTAEMGLSKVAYTQTAVWSSVEVIPTGKSRLPATPAATLLWRHILRTENVKSSFLKVATGYSPPALFEMTDSLGALRNDLRPETGVNFEWRGIAHWLNGDLSAEANVYHHTIFNTIVPRTLSNGRSYFENRGSTTQMGIEGLLRLKTPTDYESKALRALEISLNGTFQYYYFNAYQLGGLDFRGKLVPGVPLFTANLQADIAFKPRLTWSVTAQGLGRTYLNNGNTAQQSAYVLVHSKLAYDFQITRRGQSAYQNGGIKPKSLAKLQPYVGVNNLLNTQYTNFPSLNAALGRYYNPAPGINFYGGLQFGF